VEQATDLDSISTWSGDGAVAGMLLTINGLAAGMQNTG